MATTALPASSMPHAPLQIAPRRLLASLSDRLETWLEGERDQLFLWVPVMIGGGVAAWFLLPGPVAWAAALLFCVAVALGGGALARGDRTGRAMIIAALSMAVGLGIVWVRATVVAAPVLARPVIVQLEARVDRVDRLQARGLVRLKLSPMRVIPGPDGDRKGSGTGRTLPVLPPMIRVNLSVDDAPPGLAPGATIRLGARLVPPPPPSVPGAYDFARVAWFEAIGATGRGFGPVEILGPGPTTGRDWRARLSAHIQSRIAGAGGAIAAALATGDQGAMPPEDAEAMRRAGLAHLLSVSGLHITAVVGGVMFLVLRLLALSPWLALRVRLPLVAAGAAALAAIGYTVLTGAEVPTVRSCVAALMVLAAMALGRQAVTLRLVAVGAIIVLLRWPEALVGPSFQLSFAAVTAIIALHEQEHVRRLFAARDEAWSRWAVRQLAALLLTGIVVEAALAPIGLYHFHKAGLYGAAANIVAIPLTTFVIMPLEALALLFDLAGLGAPLWWMTGAALSLLLRMAHWVAAAPGSVATLPAMPGGAFGLMVAGGLWIALWRSRARLIGLLPFALGAAWALATPPPDLLVTGDGRHVVIRTARGELALLRDRAGDYTRAMMAENGGVDGEPVFLSDQPDARCSRDLCLAERVTGSAAGDRRWRILATRSAYLLPADGLIDACRAADIVVSERRLPNGCEPRWLRLDRPMLARSGGVAVTLASDAVRTVFQAGDRHPWLVERGQGGIKTGSGRRYAGGRATRSDGAGGHHPISADGRRTTSDYKRQSSSRPRLP